jgi:hypothetical protein
MAKIVKIKIVMENIAAEWVNKKMGNCCLKAQAAFRKKLHVITFPRWS